MKTSCQTTNIFTKMYLRLKKQSEREYEDIIEQ